MRQDTATIVAADLIADVGSANAILFLLRRIGRGFVLLGAVLAQSL